MSQAPIPQAKSLSPMTGAPDNANDGHSSAAEEPSLATIRTTEATQESSGGAVQGDVVCDFYTGVCYFQPASDAAAASNDGTGDDATDKQDSGASYEEKHTSRDGGAK